MAAKKSNLTKAYYQSQFLPVIEKAETEIKKLITYHAFNYKSKYELREKINCVIKGVAKKLPLDLIDREYYITGLYYSSERMIKEFYDKVLRTFLILMMFLRMTDREVYKNIQTPKELDSYFKKHETQIRSDVLRAKLNEGFTDSESKIVVSAKGSPNVEDYPRYIKLKVKELAETQSKSGETSTTPTSLWAKAERDLRHNNQLEMIANLKAQGVRYAWTSSHPDCSKRCSCWQGKLFDLEAPKSELSGSRMREKVEGKTVYCFNEVISKLDKYGYTNNIVVGFNCRHKLIPFITGSVPPVEFSKEEMEANRKINARLREMEREIRALRQQAILISLTDKEQAKRLNKQADKLFKDYKKVANDNGYAWYEWRCKV